MHIGVGELRSVFKSYIRYSFAEDNAIGLMEVQRK